MTFTITCYNQTKTFPDTARKKMMKFYEEGIMACEGAEQERYVSVYMGLKEGAKNVDDDWKWQYETVERQKAVPIKSLEKGKTTIRRPETVKKTAVKRTKEYGTIRPQTVKKRTKTNQMGLDFYLSKR